MKKRIVAVACTVNVIGDLVLVAGLHMDAAAAWASVLLMLFITPTGPATRCFAGVWLSMPWR